MTMLCQSMPHLPVTLTSPGLYTANVIGYGRSTSNLQRSLRVYAWIMGPDIEGVQSSKQKCSCSVRTDGMLLDLVASKQLRSNFAPCTLPPSLVYWECQRGNTYSQCDHVSSWMVLLACVIYACVLCGSGTPYLMNIHVSQDSWGTEELVY